jgi:two-component sensor histidine kinase
VIHLLYIEKDILFSDPVGALTSIKERMYDHERLNMDEYLEFLAQSVWKFHQRGMEIQGETLEEKCGHCIQQLMDFGLITLH